jgi:hypothetical protein
MLVAMNTSQPLEQSIVYRVDKKNKIIFYLCHDKDFSANAWNYLDEKLLNRSVASRSACEIKNFRWTMHKVSYKKWRVAVV